MAAVKINTSSPHRILRLRKVSERTGLACSTIYDRIKNHEFPKQISLGPQSVGWLESEIADWIQARIAATRETK